jgi:hypothetical protein
MCFKYTTYMDEETKPVEMPATPTEEEGEAAPEVPGADKPAE